MSDPSGNGQPVPAPGLPPVVAPSGRFIAQLFVVPGLIVAGAIIAILGFSWLSGVGQPGDKKKYIENLTSSNSDIRWRTAADLAQVLRRDEQLTLDVNFGLRLTDLLRQSVTDLERAEKDMASEGTDPAAGATPAEQRMTAKRAAFLKQRSFVQYLCNCAGNLRVPVSAGSVSRSRPPAETVRPKVRRAIAASGRLGVTALGRQPPAFPRIAG